MAWEQRSASRFYYQHVKRAGKVHRIYVGSGPEAERIAAADAARRAEREQGWQQWRAMQADLRARQQLLDPLDETLARLSAGVLLAHGFGYNRRRWRSPHA